MALRRKYRLTDKTHRKTVDLRLHSQVTYLKEQRQKVNNGYQHYCDGNREIAEQLFTEVSECTIVDISDMAKTNLAYMVRRNETTT